MWVEEEVFLLLFTTAPSALHTLFPLQLARTYWVSLNVNAIPYHAGEPTVCQVDAGHIIAAAGLVSLLLNRTYYPNASAPLHSLGLWVPLTSMDFYAFLKSAEISYRRSYKCTSVCFSLHANQEIRRKVISHGNMKEKGIWDWKDGKTCCCTYCIDRQGGSVSLSPFERDVLKAFSSRTPRN